MAVEQETLEKMWILKSPGIGKVEWISRNGKEKDLRSKNCPVRQILQKGYVQKNLPQEVDIRTTPGFANYRFCSFETGESSRSGFIYPNAKLSVCQQQLTSNQHNKIN
uniref:Uncharacterized protein n=1 Tax=Sphaerodactylus townsendi TaxID=933632 RepID=A0ACB8FCH1_9SAUR